MICGYGKKIIKYNKRAHYFSIFAVWMLLNYTKSQVAANLTTQHMKYKGVTYDIGIEYAPGILTRTGLTSDLLVYDISEIKNNLNCNSIRIYGNDDELLILASELALQNGLNVWLSPRYVNADTKQTIEKLNEIAARTEVLRVKYANNEIILITGGEASIDTKGFLKGETIFDRIQNLSKPSFFIKKALGFKPEYQKDFISYLKQSADTVRSKFKGKITYASALWEDVDWSIFDIVSINLYKASFNKLFFERKVKQMSSIGKPLAITEFGCCCYVGADEKGPTGFSVLETTNNTPVFKENCERSEKTQATYITDLLLTYQQANVEATFIFDFYSQKYTYDDDPNLDYDKASFGITKSVGQNKWEPKLSFNAIAKFYNEK